MIKAQGYRIIGLAIFFSLLLSYNPVTNLMTDFCIEAATETNAFASVINSDLDSSHKLQKIALLQKFLHILRIRYTTA